MAVDEQQTMERPTKTVESQFLRRTSSTSGPERKRTRTYTPSISCCCHPFVFFSFPATQHACFSALRSAKKKIGGRRPPVQQRKKSPHPTV